jgi:hypothetical protein
LSNLFWFCAQVISLSIFSVIHHAAKFFCDRLRVVKTSVVEALQTLQSDKKESFSHGMISTLEGSAKRFSLDIYRSALCRTLKLLDEDHELEDFVAGIPGLSESDALRRFDPLSPNYAGRVVLAALPGPATFHEQLPWSIVQLSQRAIASDLSEIIRHRRTQACLKALYYIPGAIRDVLAPYAAGTYYCLEILPLLNSSESLSVIEELWDTANDDIALSVRCVAAAISAFIISPPVTVLDKFLSPGVPFIKEKEPGSHFLSERLHMGENGEGGDSARLQNIVLFLKDIRTAVSSMDVVLWMRPDSGGSLLEEVQAERRTLRESRHAAEYRSGIFKAHGNRTSPSFVPAVQHDLLALTLEIVTRDSVADAGQAQRDAFYDAFSELETFVRTEGPEGRIMETAEMVVGALRPVAEKLGLPVSTPRLGPETPNDLHSAASGAASSSTTQGAGVESEPERRAGDDEVTPGGLPLAPSEAAPSSAIEGVTVTNGSASAPQTGSPPGTSPTSPNESSHPSPSLTSSSERRARDPATLV